MKAKLISAAVGLFLALFANSQKQFIEGTIVYDVIVKTGCNEPRAADLLDGATQKVFLKGNMSRTEMSSLLGTSVTIHDSKNGTATRLNEYGDQKIMIKLTKENFTEINKKYEGVSFEKSAEAKVIAGYQCSKAIGRLKDGSTFTVFYTTELVPANKDYDLQFKGLPGLVLEYEASLGGLQVTFTTSKISFDLVPNSKFDLPKSGFREMTYEESKGIK
ncbi:MAG TPA: DUF4412 domain-containing protein [Chitinophagaceae bacterium]|nr:DUF4412 domain-containing protein [Chitinophagaceae bacterium]